MVEVLNVVNSLAMTPLADAGGVGIGPKTWAYAIFIGLVLVFLVLDLGVFHREAHVITFKEALMWSAIWVTCGLGFAGVVYAGYERGWMGLGRDTPMYNPASEADPGAPLIIKGNISGEAAASQYLTGYVVEKSLAMDNIFVIALIFGFFAVPAKYQHRVLFWGIIGALLMRGVMIFAGAGIILKYQWVLIIFGGFLLLTALKMAVIKGHDDPSQNIAVRIIKRFWKVTDFYDGQKFFTKRTVKPTYSIDSTSGKEVMDPPPRGTLGNQWVMTPLFLTLVLVEVTDLVFAVDSIPAIFAITPDPFIVFTSNIFAILGLRSLYFCLAALITKFRYLKPALILILAFVGVKLLLLSLPPYVDDVAGVLGMTVEPMKSIKISTAASLMVVLGLLAVAVLASVMTAGRAGASADNIDAGDRA